MSTFSFFKSILPAALLLAGSTAARSWVQKSDIRGSQFLDTYSFYSGPDPTHGQVNFAQGPMLTWVDDDSRFNMKVDTHSSVKSGYRGSVRISSNYRVGDGVIIANITHAPSGCSVWPAFWTLGEGLWPFGAEIDLLEWANDAELDGGDNAITLHTQPGCSFKEAGEQSGRLLSKNCDVFSTDNRGCSIRATSPDGANGTAARGFNANGGGIIAMERDFGDNGHGIRVWQWPRNNLSAIPDDVLAGNKTVNPSAWGTPTASFPVNPLCGNLFNDHQIIFDITLGGTWAAGAWGGTKCEDKFGSISNMIQNHGSAYDEAYWSVDSVKHFVSYKDLKNKDDGFFDDLF
ncbi:unnamed protein product [Tilletia controversa]|uniref:GH16 domain-containing protein n=3 Tax=Tilletia TaxID=13289 RepID=A0A8X7SYS8_9BASI|nr:hypothetical protein CF336_g355 [Tilletia laevis]KAE8203390.1 hypothetical protein CF328_g1684 [Tilletia controversa]KAE8263773.1 hypothetical protein A4X03_0g1431 [Tilletia caries]KAE8204339.1 hypothetical protein CF335_g2693 [Tilletia laevis]KAE8252404.1 hypothetical protein A4X06_0g2216 [Tilletia controversa]